MTITVHHDGIWDNYTNPYLQYSVSNGVLIITEKVESTRFATTYRDIAVYAPSCWQRIEIKR